MDSPTTLTRRIEGNHGRSFRLVRNKTAITFLRHRSPTRSSTNPSVLFFAVAYTPVVRTRVGKRRVGTGGGREGRPGPRTTYARNLRTTTTNRSSCVRCFSSTRPIAGDLFPVFRGRPVTDLPVAKRIGRALLISEPTSVGSTTIFPSKTSRINGEIY